MLIDYNKAKLAFDKFINDYNVEDGKINLKLIHTFKVVDSSEYIASHLNLTNDDIELAKIIALLHDIGRFEQIKLYNSFIDHETLNHAEYGAKILFEDGMIREFIETDMYDNIIEKAIKNHNKYSIEDGLTEEELLHSKIIRDADKVDIFRVIANDRLNDIANIDEEEISHQTITDEIYNDFMNKKSIVSTKRKTHMDMLVSFIAFIFDYNFSPGLKFIKEKNYINILVDRITYKNEDTKEKMENIRKFATNYIEERIKNIKI